LALAGEDFTTEFQREISRQLGVAHITHWSIHSHAFLGGLHHHYVRV
jgi:hypothetical protein